MGTTCNCCEGTGFRNVEQVPFDMLEGEDPHGLVLGWIQAMAHADKIGGPLPGDPETLPAVIEGVPVEDFAAVPFLSMCGMFKHDVCVCSCCGDGEGSWHGTPGEHYNDEDPQGPNGPYAYNGGLCECH